MQMAAGLHGVSGGIFSSIDGGSFGSGFASGAVSSLIASGVGALGKNAGAFSIFSDKDVMQALQYAAGGLSGGISSALAGGNFWQGAKNGLIVTGLNHLGNHVLTSINRRKLFKNLLKLAVERKPFEMEGLSFSRKKLFFSHTGIKNKDTGGGKFIQEKGIGTKLTKSFKMNLNLKNADGTRTKIRFIVRYKSLYQIATGDFKILANNVQAVGSEYEGYKGGFYVTNGSDYTSYGYTFNYDFDSLDGTYRTIRTAEMQILGTSNDVGLKHIELLQSINSIYFPETHKLTH